MTSKFAMNDINCLNFSKLSISGPSVGRSPASNKTENLKSAIYNNNNNNNSTNNFNHTNNNKHYNNKKQSHNNQHNHCKSTLPRLDFPSACQIERLLKMDSKELTGRQWKSGDMTKVVKK